jgi:hypothetical protein
VQQNRCDRLLSFLSASAVSYTYARVQSNSSPRGIESNELHAAFGGLHRVIRS